MILEGLKLAQEEDLRILGGYKSEHILMIMNPYEWRNIHSMTSYKKLIFCVHRIDEPAWMYWKRC